MIDWSALIQVVIVTLIGAVAIVSIVSLGAKFMEYAAEGRKGGYATAGYALLGIAVVIVGFGFYLLIPHFH